mmetsp:Transcript_5572/g.12366  ORF Transcript_5572/g.12366 Transcript_5572/m.12366 type:complete len:216 (-) Transcript_5572:93-740(-)
MVRVVRMLPPCGGDAGRERADDVADHNVVGAVVRDAVVRRVVPDERALLHEESVRCGSKQCAPHGGGVESEVELENEKRGEPCGESVEEGVARLEHALLLHTFLQRAEVGLQLAPRALGQGGNLREHGEQLIRLVARPVLGVERTVHARRVLPRHVHQEVLPARVVRCPLGEVIDDALDRDPEVPLLIVCVQLLHRHHRPLHRHRVLRPGHHPAP